MTEQDDVHQIVVGQAASGRVLGPRCVPYEQYGGLRYYGYHDHPYRKEPNFMGIIPWTLRILKLCATGLLLLASSATMYLLFYWAVMPGSHASKNLSFDYTGTLAYPHQNVTSYDTKTTVAADVANILDNDECPSSSSMQEHSYAYMPWASVDLFAIEQAVSWGETIHAELIPPPTIKDRIFQPRTAYYVEVHLYLPESNWNRQIGMFGVAVDLISQPDQRGIAIKLASSVRPARLPYESAWIAVVRKLVWIVPLVLGYTQESQVVVVPVFRHILESQDYPLRHIVTRLVSQKSKSFSQPHPGQMESQELNNMPPVEVVGGAVLIGKELNQWQQVLKDWFYSCFLMGIIFLFGAQVGVLILVQVFWKENKDAFGEPYFDQSYDFSGFSKDDLDFGSIRGGESRHGVNYGESTGNSENRGGNNETCSTDGKSDEDSDNWEECHPRNFYQDKAEAGGLLQRQSADGSDQDESTPCGDLPSQRENRCRDVLSPSNTFQVMETESTSARSKTRRARRCLPNNSVNPNDEIKFVPSARHDKSNNRADDETYVPKNNPEERNSLSPPKRFTERLERFDTLAFHCSSDRPSPSHLEYGIDGGNTKRRSLASRSRAHSLGEKPDSKARGTSNSMSEELHPRTAKSPEQAETSLENSIDNVSLGLCGDCVNSSGGVPENMEKRAAHRGSLIAKKTQDMGCGTQVAIFQLPEAQVLDSFFRDLFHQFAR